MESARINLFLSKKLNHDMEIIAEDIGISRAEVFRRALALMKVAHQAAQDGKALAITADRTTVETIIIGLD